MKVRIAEVAPEVVDVAVPEPLVGPPPVFTIGESLAFRLGESIADPSDRGHVAAGRLDDRHGSKLGIDDDLPIAGPRDEVTVDDELGDEAGGRLFRPGQDERRQLVAERAGEGKTERRQPVEGIRVRVVIHAPMIRAVPSVAMLDHPRFALIDRPSPLQRLPRFSATLGGRADIWIKREDLLPIGLGGNKLRNLEYLIGAALADGADVLVTSGRRWSNHARLTAAVGARAGLDVHLVLSGPAAPRPGPTIVLARSFGATIHQCETAEREERDATVDRVTADLRATGRRPFVIDVGGSGSVGAFGQLQAAHEALRQATEAAIRIDTIVVPSATGGTQAGLIVGTDPVQPQPRIHGVLVARQAHELLPAIRAMVGDLRAMTGTTGTDEVGLDDGQLGAGYGRRTDEGTEAAGLLARSEGIVADPIYTAKGLAALVAQVRLGALDGQTVLFWHGGGTPGLFEPLDGD
jgi:1-aminocyclopropane-1-carboxylate deaminase/D-cysteine desulfhydrase-like pyridoxal-dependent ACC family enzyme